MHLGRRALLILAALLISGAALAQGLGLGVGFDDRRGTGNPATILLTDTAGELITATGGNLLLP